jgi:hypothetical protein
MPTQWFAARAWIPWSKLCDPLTAVDLIVPDSRFSEPELSVCLVMFHVKHYQTDSSLYNTTLLSYA